MQPFDIFYAIVYSTRKRSVYDSENKPKRYGTVGMHLWTFEGFIRLSGNSSVGVSASTNTTPTIFHSNLEAEETLKVVKTLLTGPSWEGFQFWIEVFRLTESDWNSHIVDDDVCRSRDARRLAYGMLHYDTIAHHVKKLAGKVLTILDAAYVNENQNKAVKDLTKNSFRSQLSDIWKWAFEDPNCESNEDTYQKDIILDD